MRLPTKKELLELHLMICISGLAFVSLYLLGTGLLGGGGVFLKQWMCAIVGWIGLVVAVKLNSILRPEKKN
ncbi:MAG: hypothetical protein PHO67_07040 [Candidatus Omnitrophica bacterium]|nr:hypothetical protein [Candidatus Omnitrophota bacterium]